MGFFMDESSGSLEQSALQKATCPITALTMANATLPGVFGQER
jgi:hypothetical protein